MKVKYLFLLLIIHSFSLFQFIHAQSSGTWIADSSIVRQFPKALDIVNINFEMERARKKLLKMNNYLETESEFVVLDSLVEQYDGFVEREKKEFKAHNPQGLSKYFLWLSLVNSKIVSVQEDILHLDFDKKVWQLTYENEKSTGDPINLTERISGIINEIEKIELKLKKHRLEMVIREETISEIVSITDDVLEEVSHLQQYQRDHLFLADKPILWKTKFSKDELFPVMPRLKKAWHENAKTVSNFSREVKYPYVVLIALFIVLLFFLIKRGFAKLGLSDEDPNFVVVQRVFSEHPFAAIVSLIVTIFILFNSTIPLVLTGLLGIILLTCALFFLPAMIGKQGKVIVLMVLIIYIVNLLEIIIWYYGNYARLFITGEAILALYLTYKYGLNSFRRVSKSAAPFVKKVWFLSIVLFALFAAAFVSNLFGFVNLAVLVQKIGVKIAAIVVIIFAAHSILRAMVLASIEIGRGTKSKVLEKRWDIIEKRMIQMIHILAVLVLLKYVLQNMDIYRPAMDWLIDFLDHNWEIGTMDISIGGILSLILILVISFGLASFVKVVVEDEFLVRTNLPKGVPAAISVTIRYFIIVLGIAMALSSAGIDLGKFGLLASALGVGIGFGLQNIVSNFISGLILVYERPANVGDTVEVENLMGIVKRIGVRSSSVRTFDGAEVIVPNANLISNQMINWTLSDNQRRLDIKIGAAYGSDPNLILELLEKVANNHEDVLKTPGPTALFEEFGDSSLNFRLLCWVPFELGIGVKSDIAIGIYNIFAENNIIIPFPQVDLNVKKEDEDLIAGSDKNKPDSKKNTTKPTKRNKNTKKLGPVEDQNHNDDK